jgi:hypothetical protein
LLLTFYYRGSACGACYDLCCDQGKTGEGKTRRLLLRPLEVADAGQIQLLFPHWEIVRYLAREAVPWPYPDDGALQYCRDIVLPAMEQETGWHWTIRMATDPSQSSASSPSSKAKSTTAASGSAFPGTVEA